MSSKLPFVCMPGSAYTGSTLLAFLMNAHPACVSIGAATGPIDSVDLDGFLCSCGRLFLECPFWKEVEARTRQLEEPLVLARNGWPTRARISRYRPLDVLLLRSLRSDPLNRVRDRMVRRIPSLRQVLVRIRRANSVLARAVLDVSGKSVFVDSARDPIRPPLLSESEELDVSVIHLVRDVRPCTLSHMRNMGIPDPGAAARVWRRANRETERIRRRFPPERWMRLHYETLCRDVQGSLDTVADFLGVPPAARPADFRDVEHHILGNRMRLAEIGRVVEDRSWEGRLDPVALRSIARVAGDLNRELGYPWPVSEGSA